MAAQAKTKVYLHADGPCKITARWGVYRPDGLIADCFRELSIGESMGGVPWEDLLKAAQGTGEIYLAHPDG
jgi:hypothetical protein